MDEDIGLLMREGAETIRRLRLELEQLRAERAWQPIETAPKDGEPVLLYKPDEARSGEYRVVGYWGQWPGEPEGWIACAGYGLRPPTHWQPLPSPPVKEGA